VFLVGNLALSVLAFPFYVFVLCGARKSPAHRIPFCIILSLFGCGYFVLFGYLSGLKTLMYNSFIFFRSLIGDFFSFVFFRSLTGNPFFCFLPIFDRELYFSFFVFFRGRGWKVSSRVKVYGKLGFWLKACRTAGHDICQGIGLASGSGIKECPTLFP